MSEFTEIQSEIVRYAKDHPEASGQEIAEAVGCSPSYANRIRRLHLDAILGDHDLSKYTQEISLAHPYTIFLDQNTRQDLGLEDTSVVEITIEGEDNHHGIKAPIDDIGNINLNREVHAHSYWFHSMGEDTPEVFPSNLDNFFDDDSNDTVSIYTANLFEEFIDEVERGVEATYANANICLGVGLLEYGISAESDEDDWIEFPWFDIISDVLHQIFQERIPRLLTIESFSDEFANLETVYIQAPTGVGDREKEKAELRAKEIRYFDLERTAKLSGVSRIFGPFTPEVGVGVLDIRDSDIQFVPSKARVAIAHPEFSEDGPEPAHGPSFDAVVDVITSLVEGDGLQIDDFDIGVNVLDDHGLVRLEHNSVNLFINTFEQGIGLYHPGDIEVIETIADAVFGHLLSQFTDLHPLDSFEITPIIDRYSKAWVFDTNAIYHQIVDDDASSILKTILPNKQLYQEDIIITWPVLYEINKHKDDTDSGPPPSVQKVGVDNLLTLRKLDDRGFINLKVDTIPENIRTRVSESHVADMHVLQRAQDQDAILVSGDRRLQDIAEVSSIEYVDISDFAVVEDLPDLTDDIWDNVAPKIGAEISTESEILGEIEAQQSDLLEEKFYSIDATEPEAETYLRRWINDKKIISCCAESTGNEGEYQLLFDRAVEKNVVITPSVAARLTNHITEYDGSKYFRKEALEYLSNILNLQGPGLPLLTLHVPISSILGPQSMTMTGISAEARNFYELSQVANADYRVEEVEQSPGTGDKIRDSVQLAIQNQYSLLCTDTDRYINPIGGLLGLDVREFDL